MVVEVLKTCEHTGIKEGEFYEARSFGSDKVELLRRLPDGFEPECAEYRHNIKSHAPIELIKQLLEKLNGH